MEDPLTVPPAGTAPTIVVARRRELGRRSTADVVSVALLGGGFLAVAALSAGAAAMRLDVEQWLLLLGLVVVYAVAVRSEFEGATGSAVPTEPVLVVLLLALPPVTVPFAVLLGLLLGSRRDDSAGGLVNRTGVRAISGWHCVGPVLVLGAAGVDGIADLRWPWAFAVLALALAAQQLFDATTAVVRCLALGVSLRDLWVPLGWTFLVDALLAPIGVCIALAGGARWPTLPLLLAPAVLMHLVGRDRARHLSEAVTISQAYERLRGMALADPLTGLLNRRGWDEAVSQARAQVAGGDGLRALVVVGDLDHLKATNDVHGHVVGDGLLRAAGQAMREAAGASGVVARLGGDEFGVLVVTDAPLARDGSDPAAAALMRRVAAELDDLSLVGGVPVSVSLGVAAWPPELDLGTAFHRADEASRADKLARAAARDLR